MVIVSAPCCCRTVRSTWTGEGARPYTSIGNPASLLSQVSAREANENIFQAGLSCGQMFELR